MPVVSGQVESEELERTLASLRADFEVAHVLLGLAGVLAEVRSVEDTLDRAVTVVATMLEADRCFAATWGGRKQRFQLQAHEGFDEEGAALLRELGGRADGLPLVRAALEEKEPLIVPDVLADGRIPAADVERRRLGAFIGIPLVANGDELGVLGVEFARPRDFGAKAEALARGVARQLGVALVNARRFNLLSGLRTFGISFARQLSLDAVIDQVAWGASDLLSADCATVYFLDATHRSLTAAGGVDALPDVAERLTRIDLDDEPWKALLEGQPVVIPDLKLELGRERGPLSVIAAPIPGEGSPVLGAIIVFFLRYLANATDECEALSVLAGQAGMAIENAHRFERQRRVARSLQEGLLSNEMPQMEGCEVAAFYEPASGGDADVGGDFYDVFDVANGRYAVVVGDVSGKGAEAAARTAMAKYMLRAFATGNPAPASVLFHLNNALAHDLEDDRFATLVYGVLDPPARRLTIVRAGHPPPLVYRHATGKVEALEDLHGSIVGAFPEQQFQQETYELEPGDVFLLYTDGLIETRSAAGFYGRKRIEESFARNAAILSPNDLTRRIYRDAREFGQVTDDTVVFALAFRNGV